MIYFIGIVLTGIFLGAWWYIQDKRRYSKWPPGPPRVPLLGCLPFFPVAPTPGAVFDKLAAKYGDVFHLKLGLVDVVAFSSFKSVTAILKHDMASGRKPELSRVLFERMHRRNLGIIFSSGDSQMTMRRFTTRTLHEFGFGKSASMDYMVNQELKKFMTSLKAQIEKHPEGIEAEDMFGLSTISIMWRLVTAVDYEPGDEKLLRFVNLVDKLGRAGSFSFDAFSAYPFLYDLFPKWSGKTVMREIDGEFEAFAKDVVEERKETGMYKVEPQCYVDAFLAKIDECEADPKSEFNMDQIILCILDLLAAGSETNSKTISFALLYCIVHPHVQEKVQDEIDRKIGTNEDITLSMKTRLPYTWATILEIQRMINTLPFTPPRMATEDFWFEGYLIKKGAPLLVNLEAANMSQSQWKDPQNFRPDRFLTEDGTLDYKVASNLVSFGDGKRVCLGQSLAETFLLIYFASLLRTFKLEKADGEEPSTVPSLAFTNKPEPFKVRFIPRQL